MKPIWRFLALGITAMFLLQSCVTVHPLHRHRRHHHRHCLVVEPPTKNTVLSDFSIAGYPVTFELVVYGNNG